MDNKDEMQKMLDKYLKKGFGSMNKNDFEVFIFNELLSSRFIEKNDYAISLELQIPVSKVKRLRYEASLKYPKNFNSKEMFIKALKGARYEKEQIVFVCENVALRQYLRSKLLERGNFYDTSFNSEIVKISNKDFFSLLEDIIMDQQEIDEIEKAINEYSDRDVSALIVKFIADFAENKVGKTGGELINIGLNKVVKKIKEIF